MMLREILRIYQKVRENSGHFVLGCNFEWLERIAVPEFCICVYIQSGKSGQGQGKTVRSGKNQEILFVQTCGNLFHASCYCMFAVTCWFLLHKYYVVILCYSTTLDHQIILECSMELDEALRECKSQLRPDRALF